jgi:hypothetical protein
MFQPLIDQARDMIQRLYTNAERGRDGVAEAHKLRFSEFEAWETAARGIVGVVFEADTAEVARWRGLAERRRTLVGDAMRQDMKRGEYYGLIDYFHLAVGILLEFEATYQHEMAALAASERSHSGGRPAQPGGHEQLLPPAIPPQPEEQRSAVRRVGDGWELTITLRDTTYEWLTGVAAREAAYGGADGEATARLAATIVERVAANAKRGGAR